MKIFDREIRREAPVVALPKKPDPHVLAVEVPLDDGRPGLLKIDRAIRIGGWRLVTGWCSGPIGLAIRTTAGEPAVTRFAIPRPDVAADLGIESADELGFVLASPASEDEAELLCGRGDQQQAHPIRTEPMAPLDANALALMMPALRWLASTMKPFGQEWIQVIKALPADDASGTELRGMLDTAAANDEARGGLVSGWVAAPESAVVWLQDAEGGVHGFDRAFRIHREDVCIALATDMSTPVPHQPGFSVWLEGLSPGTTLYLKALQGQAIVQLAQVRVDVLPSNPVGASRLLFANLPDTRLTERMTHVDAPVLDALIAADRHRWKSLPVLVHEVGCPVGAPRVSIIVPLYGRADFVEHQLMEFDRDPWLKRNAELIYVVDDRALIERFATDVHGLHRLYGMPLRWIWGGANRGFAGANNLGAAHAAAPLLLFMNSDVFPQSPGWLLLLLQVLEQRRDIGIVAPRLVYGDGAIQHAGMEFVWREELGIWINHHPLKGLDPVFDPHQDLVVVPAVTGACVAIRREDFQRVGGWDDGYLIGDFEDSDLCLKLRQEGLQSAYLPQVQLTHLERQSFQMLHQGHYRWQVMMYNALRHQRRWHHVLESQPAGAGRGVLA